MFSNKPLPAVGISIGIERIFSILEEVYKNDSSVRPSETDVLVASVGKTNLTSERLKILNELWENGVKAEILYNETPRMDKQNDFVTTNKIPFMIFIGDDEVKNGTLKLKSMSNKKEVELKRDSYIEELKKLINDPLNRIN